MLADCIPRNTLAPALLPGQKVFLMLRSHRLLAAPCPGPRRELCFCRAFRLGGDTLCFELARRPERPRHQPRASLKAAREINRLGLVLMQTVASGPSK